MQLLQQQEGEKERPRLCAAQTAGPPCLPQPADRKSRPHCNRTHRERERLSGRRYGLRWEIREKNGMALPFGFKRQDGRLLGTAWELISPQNGWLACISASLIQLRTPHTPGRAQEGTGRARLKARETHAAAGRPYF